MGRTITAYTQQLDLIETRLKKFRTALRRQDRELFDQCLLSARRHSQAGVMAAAANPMDSFLLSVIIEQQREIRALKIDIEKIKERNT